MKHLLLFGLITSLFGILLQELGKNEAAIFILSANREQGSRYKYMMGSCLEKDWENDSLIRWSLNDSKQPWTNAMEWCKPKWNRAWECTLLFFLLNNTFTLGHPIFPCVKHYRHMYLSDCIAPPLAPCANANSTALQLDFLIKNFWTVTVFQSLNGFLYFLAIYGATTISSISQKKKKKN